MTVRAVEGKKPYTGGKAIEITEDKVINLRLRDENNLIIWDSEDNEIYVDLQLGDEIAPTDTFPVGITTGRAIVDNGWDATGTLVCFKTTSGDNIKLFYTDSGSVFVDNGTGTFKQIYLKSEVDALLATKQNLLTAGDNITIDSNNVISSDKGIVISNTQPSDATEGLLWYNVATGKLKVYNGTDWNDLGITYTAGNGILIDQNNEISVDTTVVATQTDLASKQDELVSGTNIKTVNSNSLLGSGDVTINEVPSGGTDGQVLTKVSGSPAWANPTGGGGDVSVSTDTGNELTTGAKLWLGTTTDFSSIVNPDSNTMYIQYTSSGGGGWQPGANTIAYWTLNNTLADETGNNDLTQGSGSFVQLSTGRYILSLESSSNTNGAYCTCPDLTNKNLTLNIWYKDTATRVGYGDESYFNTLNGSNNLFGLSAAGPSQENKLYTVVGNWNNWNDAPVYNDLSRHNVVSTFDYSTQQVKCYVDGELKSTSTSSSSISYSSGTIYIGKTGYNNTAYMYIGATILENKIWDATEVSDYYDLTKGDYGIS